MSLANLSVQSASQVHLVHDGLVNGTELPSVRRNDVDVRPAIDSVMISGAFIPDEHPPSALAYPLNQSGADDVAAGLPAQQVGAGILRPWLVSVYNSLQEPVSSGAMGLFIGLFLFEISLIMA